MKEHEQTTAPQIWIRLPTKGRCPHTGLSRSHFYTLIAAGAIRSANVRSPGKLTGVRLVWLPSVMEHIERFVEMPPGPH
jgi:predicted DNA-binding transcriptional regulator AlpA